MKLDKKNKNSASTNSLLVNLRAYIVEFILRESKLDRKY